jgi:hypothetical protein
VYGTGIPRRTKAGIPESPAGKSAIQPPSRVACRWRFCAARASDPGAGEGPGQVLRLPGCSESFSFSRGFGFPGRAGLWARPCRLRVPIPALIRGVPAANPRPDPDLIRCAFRSRFRRRFPGRQCGDSGPVCVRFAAPGGAVARMRFLAVLRTGWRGDTPPLKGCCTVTLGYRARTC